MATSPAEPPLAFSPKTPLWWDLQLVLSRALGCEHSPAQHPQPSIPQGLSKQQGQSSTRSQIFVQMSLFL